MTSPPHRPPHPVAAVPPPARHERELPPLRDLPSPPRIPRERAELVPPQEIILESRGELTRRLLRHAWAPGLMLLALWYVLWASYVWGAAPAYLTLTLLVALAEPQQLSATLLGLGFRPDALWASALLLPIGASALSIALLPLASAWISRIAPREHLSERSFQRQVSGRIATVMLAPPMLTALALTIAVPLGVPMPWSSLGTGPLAALSISGLAMMGTWLAVRARMSAPRILGIKDLRSLEVTARLDRDHDRRRAAARQVLAQDRRHLPPVPGSPESRAALSPAGMLRSLQVIGRAGLTWVGVPLLTLGWMVFGIADMVLLFSSGMQDDLLAITSPLSWQMVLIAVPLLLLVVAASALAPALAALLSQGRRGEAKDLRTYATWTLRARVNPWESSLALWTGAIAAVLAAAATVVLALALWVLALANGLTSTWIAILLLVIAPLYGVAAMMGMRERARDVFYGPPGRYMRRETPYALVVPEFGTRAERADDPAVRAQMRRRMRAEQGEEALALFDVDDRGERLWVDDSQPGARPVQLADHDVQRGRLPDFGADDSPFRAGGEERPEHQIPETLTRPVDR